VEVVAAAEEPQLLSKEAIVVIPLIGTAIAISYDVGYFYGIDINFFTLFSVAEHVVFALQAAPAALGTAILQIYVGSGFDIKVGKAIAAVGRRSNSFVHALAIVAIFVAVGTTIYFQKWGMAAGLAAGVVAALSRMIPFAKRTVYSVAGVLVVVAAFAIGHDSARSYLSSDEVNHSIQIDKNFDLLKVHIIRTGDRGVLYYDPKVKQLSFVRWEAVKKLTSDW
jgi:hypothetical protein